MRTLVIRYCFLGVVCLALTTGCGKKTGELSGTVTHQERLVLNGSVIVVGNDGIVHSGVIQPDGTYSVTGVPAGPVKIAVNSPDPGKQRVAVRKPEMEEKKPKPDNSTWFAIPDQYGDIEKAGLTYTMRRGKNLFNIELK